MKIAVWDTYVKKQDNELMHFDILVSASVKDSAIVYNYGKSYLESKGIYNVKISSEECQLCHIEKASEEVETKIKKQGFSIIEMENCN